MRDVFRTTTPIRYLGHDGWASGFFYYHDSGDYLITNQHVLYDTNNELDDQHQPTSFDTVVVRLRNKTELDKTDTHRIQLLDGGTPIWGEHPDDQVDLAAVPLEIDIYNETGNIRVGSGRFYISSGTNWSTTGVEASASAIVAGYPIKRTDGYVPILRDALISTPMDPTVGNDSYFLIDANLHEGTSGSPVFVKGGSDGRQLQFAGVHSGQYDLREEGSENLNRVWYRDLIDETIEAATPE